RLAGRRGTERCALEERHLHVFREDMEAEEPDILFDAVEGRVPLYCFLHPGNGLREDRIEPAADILFPVRHGGDVRLHRRLAIALGDLRVAAREQDDAISVWSWLPARLRRLCGALFGRFPGGRL